LEVAMTGSSIAQAILDELRHLDRDQQQRVLDFAQSLVTKPRGVPGAALLRFAGTIPEEDVRTMEKAIEAGCEQVDEREW
jgi:hypothetical protein